MSSTFLAISTIFSLNNVMLLSVQNVPNPLWRTAISEMFISMNV